MSTTTDLPVSQTRRQRPVWLVFALGFLTLGLYLPVWLWATWREMRRDGAATDLPPFVHALSFFVPVWCYFRVFAHFKAIRKLGHSVGASFRPEAATAVTNMVLSGIASWLILSAWAWILLVAYVTSGAFFAALVPAQGQRGLNAYYRSLATERVPVRVHWAEWSLLALAAILFGFVFVVIDEVRRQYGSF